MTLNKTCFLEKDVPLIKSMLWNKQVTGKEWFISGVGGESV